MVNVTRTKNKMSRFSFTSAEDYLGKADFCALITFRCSLNYFGFASLFIETFWVWFLLKPTDITELCVNFSQPKAACCFILAMLWLSCWNTNKNTHSLASPASSLNSRLNTRTHAHTYTYLDLFGCLFALCVCVCLTAVSAVWRTGTTSCSESTATSGRLLTTEPRSSGCSGDATDSSARVEVTFQSNSQTDRVEARGGIETPTNLHVWLLSLRLADHPGVSLSAAATVSRLSSRDGAERSQVSPPHRGAFLSPWGRK